MSDKKLLKYNFEMSKLEFTNSLEMYINSSDNKIFLYHKLLNIKLKKDYFDLFRIENRDKYVGQFDFNEESDKLKIIGKYKVKENWMSSGIQPLAHIFLFSIGMPLVLVKLMLDSTNSKSISIFILILTLIYLAIIPYKTYKFFSKRKKIRQEENLLNFQKDIEEVFEYIRNERSK